MENKPVVTITGVSGYLGSHVCLYFLKSGEFKVRGTVRSKTNAKKIEPLKKAFGRYFDELELVEADLTNKQSLINACEGSEYVVHVASPVPMFEKVSEEELSKQAVGGTLGILEGCRKHKVKRCVVTNSLAGILYPKGFEKISNFGHDGWSQPHVGTPYIISKTKADIAAWDYVKNLPENEKFELVTIYPGAILGPSLIAGTSSSESFLKMFMMGDISACPKAYWSIIDVRDRAESHYKAITIKGAAGKRFPMIHEHMWMIEMANVLRAKFGRDYKKIPKGEMMKCLAWIGSHFSPEVKMLYDAWGKQNKIDNTQARRVLGMQFISARQTLEDMGESLISQGIIPEQRK